MTKPMNRAAAGRVDPPARVAALDGLRGLAVAAVLCFHARLDAIPGGFLAVSVFFTLSGYLITKLLLARVPGAHRDLVSFWSRRFRRILPACLAAIAIAAFFVAVAGAPSQVAAFRGDGLAALAFVANWRFIIEGQSYSALFASPSPVLHLWSLAVEEQFYVVFPLLAIVVLRVSGGSRRVFAAVVGVLFVASAAVPHLWTLSDDRVYYGTDTRAAEILAGALLAVAMAARPDGLVTGRRGRWALGVLGTAALGLVVVACAVTQQSARWVYAGGLPLFAGLSVLVIVAALHGPNPVTKVLGARPWRALGTISLGVYLFHWPIFLWLDPGIGEPWPWARLGLAVTLTIAIAAMSYRLIEQPWRRRRGVGARPLWIAAPLAATAITVVILAVTAGLPAANNPSLDAAPGSLVSDLSALGPPGASTGAPAGAPPRTSDRGIPAAAAAVVAGPQAGGGALVPRPVVTPDHPLRVLLLGDSTAVAFTQILDRWGEDAGIWRAASYARIGCGIGRGGSRARYTWEQDVPAECDSWPTDWAAQLAAVRPDIIIVSSGFWDATDRRLPGDDQRRAPGDPTYDRYLAGEYEQAARVLTATGAAVAWIDNPPVRFGYDTPHPEQYGVNDPARMVRLNEIARDVIARHPSMRAITYSTFLAAWPGGAFDPTLRPDGVHVAETGSEPVAEWLGPEILHAYREVTGS